MNVNLTGTQIVSGALQGVFRLLEAMKNGHRPRYGYQESDRWGTDIEAALCEMAVAKATGKWWHGKGGVDRGDLLGAEVRSTKLDNGCLILHPDDDDNLPFYLVTGELGRYQVRGWIMARDGKREEYWREKVKGRPAFFVPQSALHPVEVRP